MIRIEHQIHRGIPWAALEAHQAEGALKVAESGGHSAILLASEPEPTYTFGRSANPQQRPLNPTARIEPVSRGGKWTYHGPGQLLLYPLFQLESFGYDRRQVRRFAGDLRSALKEALKEIGLETESRDEPYGLFVGGAKLASFGIAIRDGICHHGLALYVKDQSAPFAAIDPCGVPGQAVTSLEQLGFALEWEAAAQQVIETVKNYFCHSRDRLII